MVGVDSPLDVREHPAIKGAIRGAQERTKDFKQSRVLSVREVKILESLLFSQDVDPVDRYGAGVFLFQIYSRARVSDIRNLSRFEVETNGDGGYLEARTLDHKAAKRVAGLGQLLVLVAPIQGLSEAPWGKEFLKVSDSVGVKLSEGRRGPLLPRLLPSGEWSGRAISAPESSVWLNGLLEKGLGTAPAEGLTSHGMKATTLSWMTKAGYPESSCLILGHHSRGKKKSLCTYGRDVQAKPLRELCECLGLIKKGIFVPDATRSGMFNTLAESGQDCNEAPASSSPKPDESVPSGTMPEQSPDVGERQEDEAGISNSSDESDSSGSSESDSVEYDRLPPPSSLDIAAPSID